MSDGYWRHSFPELLRAMIGLLSIKPSDIADDFCDVTTVRKWLNGTRFPHVAGQQHLIEYLEKAATKNDSPALYLITCKQIEACLPDAALLSARELEANCGCNTSALMGGVLHFCFSDMSARPQKQERKELEPEKALFFQTGKATKAVVFDFDGTLTQGNLNRTTWEDIWVSLGYDVECCKYYHRKFTDGKIDHETWCKITELSFKQRNLHRQALDAIAKQIKLLPGAGEVLKHLYDNDVKVHIVSGSILSVIRAVLGENYIYIDGIKANQFSFNTQGFLEEIIGTRYDFEGKAQFIRELADELHIATSDILFVGNSLNDEYAHISGARTLCINPKYTDSENKKIWDYCIHQCSNLTEILPFIQV